MAIKNPNDAAPDCVDDVTALNAVKACQVEILGHAVPLDTKLSDVLLGAALNQYCACVARRSGVKKVGCAGSNTFRQVAESITCD